MLFKFPATNVVNKLPNICDVILNIQKTANNSRLLFSSATLLVYAPWETHKAEAENPHIKAPAQTITQTNVWLI